MIISRGSNLFRTVVRGLQKKNISTTISRNSGHSWYYRVAPDEPPKRSIYIAEVMGGFAWWWLLWHLWHEHEHITGEFEYPDPSLWTNEELGIPDDDDELGLKASE